MLYTLLLLFCFVFGFKIYSIIDSTILVGIILSILILFNNQYKKYFIKIISKRKTINVFLLMFLIILLSLLVNLFSNEIDLSYIKTFIHFMITILIGIELIAYLQYKQKQENILNYIIIIFLIQSIFQWTCYLIPSFSSLFNYFRSDSMNQMVITYSGYRGIALSQSGFFSLSSSYAIVIFLFFSKKNTLFHSELIKILSFIILLSGTFFAGRTGYVGLLFVPFLLLYKNKIKFNFKKIILIIFLIISIIPIFNITKQNEKIKMLYSYTFQLIDNYKNGKGFRSTSTDSLNNMYKIDISTKTFFLGDGKYTNSDGSYYKKTDVGYLRKILYFGIIGMLLSIFLEFAILCINVKKIDFEKLLLFFLLLILELKGEIIGMSIIVNSIVILFAFSNNKLIYEKDYSIDDNV